MSVSGRIAIATGQAVTSLTENLAPICSEDAASAGYHRFLNSSPVARNCAGIRRLAAVVYRSLVAQRYSRAELDIVIA